MTLTLMLTASVLQPVVGLDDRPSAGAVRARRRDDLHAGRPAAAGDRRGPIRCCSSPPALIGLGSSIFHPESSRVARMASGGRHGLAQSVFQVGGNAGSALGPLLAAFLVAPYGQRSIAWCALLAAGRHRPDRADRPVAAQAPLGSRRRERRTSRRAPASRCAPRRGRPRASPSSPRSSSRSTSTWRA